MLELTFAVFLRTAWCAAILLVLVWIIQRLAGRWLSPRARYALWLLVAARLVILWTPASSLSLVGQLEHRITSAMSTEPSPKVKAEPLENIAYDPTDIDVDFHFDAFPREIALAPLDIKPELPTWQWSDIPVWSIVAAIWLLGVTFFGALLGRDFWRLRKAIRSMSPVSKPKLLELVRRIEKELLWNKPVRVLLSQDLASPAVTGVFAPALLLPALFVERLTEKELEHVIRHELTHVKRRDVLVNWLLAGIGAVYWFFPLMRYLLSQLRKTRELACDAAVLHGASAQERKSYGKTLLKIMEMVSEADRPALTFTVGVAGMVWNIGNARKESQMMRERLEIVVRDRTQRGRAGWLLGVMALMLIAVGFTEAQEFKQPKVNITEEELRVMKGEGLRVVVPVERAGFEFEQRLDAPIVQSYDLTNLAKLFEDTAIRGTKSANEALRDWVSKVVRDSRWSNPKEVQIDWEGQTATIKHSAAGHARLLKAIKAFHTKPEHQFVLELSLASLSAEDFKKLDLDRLTNVRNEASRLSDPTSGATVQPQSAGETTLQRVVSQSFLLSNTELERAWVELSGLASFQRLQAPKVTTLNGEIANITVGNTRPFVTSIERIKGVDQPYVEVLFDGMQLESQAIALGDDQVWLRLQLQKSEVDTEKITTHKEGTVELQSPKVRSLSQITGVEMNDGQTLLMFIQTKGEEGKETVQVIVAKVQSISIADAPQAIEPPKHGDLKPDEKNPPAANTQLQPPPMRTEVLDVSQTPAFRTFAKLTDQDDEMRAKLLAPAYQQLEVLITETIDPESPKVLKRSMENLTLEVTASQEVLEKVNDLIKQLVRLADKEAAATQTLVTKTYNIADAIIFRVKPVAGQGASSMDGRLVKAEVKTFVALVKEVNPEFDNPDSGRKIEPDFDKLSITVTGSPQDHSRIKEHVHWMSRVILDAEKRRHQALMGAPSDKMSSPGDEGSKQNANRIGVEFTPPVFGKRRNRNQEKAAATDEDDASGDTSKATTWAYDVSDLVITIPLPEFAKLSDDQKKKFMTEDCFKEVLRRILEENPDFVERLNKGFEMKPFPTNLTLVVSGTADDHERIAKRLELLRRLKKKEPLPSSNRAAAAIRNQELTKKKNLEEARQAARNNTTVTYDVADFFLLCTTKKEGGKQPDGFDCGNPFAHIFVLLGRVRPDVAPGKDGIELQPFWTPKTLVVSAPPETQEKIAEVINYLNKLSVEDAKRLIEQNNQTDAIREQEIYFALKQRVEIDFKDKPLAEVLKLLGETTKINIVPDAAGFVEERVKPNEPVSLELKKPTTLKAALQLILDPLNLDYTVKNEALIITSKRLTKDQPTTVAYDVADLPFFADTVADLKAKREPDPAKRLAAFEKLETLVRAIPEFAEGKEGVEMNSFHTNLTLVVSAPKNVQEQVVDLIRYCRLTPVADVEQEVQRLKKR